MDPLVANLTPHGLLSPDERHYLRRIMLGRPSKHATKAPQRIAAKVHLLPSTIEHVVRDCRLLTEWWVLTHASEPNEGRGTTEVDADDLMRLLLLGDVGIYRKTFRRLPIILLLVLTLSGLSKMTGGKDRAIVETLYGHAALEAKRPNAAKQVEEFQSALNAVEVLMSEVRAGLKRAPHLNWALGNTQRMKILVALFGLEGDKGAWVPRDDVADKVAADKKYVSKVLNAAVAKDFAEKKVGKDVMTKTKLVSYRLTEGGRETVTAALVRRPKLLDEATLAI